MGVRVLVAEDEALIALSLADLLEAEGYEVALAPDGADALSATPVRAQPAGMEAKAVLA